MSSRPLSPLLIPFALWLIIISALYLNYSLDVKGALLALLFMYLLVGIPLLLAGIKIVREGCIIVWRLGRKNRVVCGPRIILVDPLLDKVSKLLVNVRLVDFVDLVSPFLVGEQGKIRMRFAVAYHILDPFIAKGIIQKIGRILFLEISFALQMVPKIEHLNSQSRANIERIVYEWLDRKLAQYGIKVYSVEIIKAE